MRGCATIRIDNDLTAGQTRIAIRAANHEAASWIDVILVFSGEPPFRQNFVQNRADDFAQLLQARRLFVLMRHNDGVYADRARPVILQRHLALCIRLKLWMRAIVSKLSQFAQDLVRIDQRGWHKFRRLVRRIAEHDALVAGAFFLVKALTGFNALCDFSRLTMDMVLDGHVLPMKPILLIADGFDHITGRLVHLILGDDRAIIGANLTCQHHAISRGQRFHRDFRGRVLAQKQIDNRVRNLI